MYALVVAVCFYGLTQSNKIFVGIADTECSILRFFDEILIGESKETLPKWTGIDGIQTLLDNIKDSLIDIKDNSMIELNRQISDLNQEEGPKQKFLSKLSQTHEKFFNGEDFINDYIRTYELPNNSGNEGKYVLDIIKNFGKYDSENEVGDPENSLIWSWVEEYKIVARTADEKLRSSQTDFNNIFNSEFDKFTSSIDKGKDTIGDLKTTFNDFKTEISGMIVDNSETIDNYGKLGFKIVFGVLALINIAIAVFMLLLCFCSGKCCTKCCCCRCICKLFTHLLWNILAILMIIVFLVGSLFSIIGKIGEDGKNAISYIVSEDNIGDGGDNILVDKVSYFKWKY